jgi:hypothetical protein
VNNSRRPSLAILIACILIQIGPGFPVYRAFTNLRFRLPGPCRISDTKATLDGLSPDILAGSKQQQTIDK